MEKCVAPGLDKFDLLLEVVFYFVRVRSGVYANVAAGVASVTFEVVTTPTHLPKLYNATLSYY